MRDYVLLLATARGVALLRHRLPDNLGLANQNLPLSGSFCPILRPEEIVSFALRAVVHSGLVLNDECCSTEDCSWNPKVAFVATRPTAAYCGYRSVNDELHTDSPFSRCCCCRALLLLGSCFLLKWEHFVPLPLTNLLFDGASQGRENASPVAEYTRCRILNGVSLSLRVLRSCKRGPQEPLKLARRR